MTDKVEIQGKTVKEAVSEGLLQMGARENEVNVTILEKPKSGLFGFLGSKQAKVLLEKKIPRGRKPRQGPSKEEHAGHGFGVSSGGKKTDTRNNRRNTGSQNRDRDGSSQRGDKKETTGSGTTSRRRGGRGRGSSQVKPQGKPQNNNVETVQPASPNNNQPRSKQSDNNGDRSKSRQQSQQSNSGRAQENNRPGPSRNNAQGKSSDKNANRNGRNMNRNRYQHRDEDMVLDRNNPHLDEQRKHFEAAERARRQEENVNNASNRAPVKREESSDTSASPKRNAPRSQGRSKPRNNDSSRRNNRDTRNQGSNDRQRPTPIKPENQIPDEMIVQGLKGAKYGTILRDIPVEESNATLEKVASELFIRAGFPANCEVVDDEYSLVKIITDDASAGMLIGRHGSTVDAIEHLVERMSCNAVGERIRMNLDINNYRQRRQEALVERVEDAVKSVLSTGKPYHVEPQDARERRMVHMEALKTEGLRTYTMYGSGGKHVVIAIDDKPKEKVSAESVSDSEHPEGDKKVSPDFSNESSVESTNVLDAGDASEENPES